MFDPTHFEWLRWAAVAVMLTVLVVGKYVLTRKPLGNHSSISLHIASDRLSYYLVGSVLTIGGLLFYSFLLFWLTPTYGISPLIYVVLPIAFVALLGVTWVPETSAKTSRLMHYTHFWSGSIVAIAMLMCLVMIISTHASIGFYSLLFTLAATIYSIVCIVLYPFAGKANKHFLIYESVFVVIFYSAIFALILKI